MSTETELGIREFLDSIGHVGPIQEKHISELKAADSKLRDRFPGIEFRDSFQWNRRPDHEFSWIYDCTFFMEAVSPENRNHQCGFQVRRLTR